MLVLPATSTATTPAERRFLHLSMTHDSMHTPGHNFLLCCSWFRSVLARHLHFRSSPVCMQQRTCFADTATYSVAKLCGSWGSWGFTDHISRVIKLITWDVKKGWLDAAHSHVQCLRCHQADFLQICIKVPAKGKVVVLLCCLALFHLFFQVLLPIPCTLLPSLLIEYVPA